MFGTLTFFVLRSKHTDDYEYSIRDIFRACLAYLTVQLGWVTRASALLHFGVKYRKHTPEFVLMEASPTVNHGPAHLG